ncbi:AAA family ATPase [Roseateles sp.]|uniref:AAA family ATPase n=1 Tax=Roseateles sp. TaxID=1971397 RepID=UPI003D1162CA
MEELELDASAFWRHFDGECRAAYRGNGTSAYERTTLLMLFLWADQPATIPAPRSRLEHPSREVQDWWAQAVGRLNELLGLARDQRLNVDAVAPEFLVRALDFLSRLNEVPPRTAAYFFDYRFMRLAERETGTNRLVSHFSASLANTLNDPNNPFVDVFCETGDLFATSGNERWRRRHSQVPYGYLFQIGSFDLEVRLRLVMHERDPRAFEKLSAREDSWSAALFRIDVPPRKVMPSLIYDDVFRGVANPSEMLEPLRWQFRAQLVLMVIAGSERTTTRRSLIDVRRRLLDEGQLAAVIDFPRTAGTRMEKTAWLIRPRPMGSGNEVLMINTAAVGIPASHQEYGSLAEFSGRIVRLFLGAGISSRWATSSREDSTAHYRYLFDREFTDGYRNVEGLCRVVSADEIRQHDYALQALRYVLPPARRAWLSGIDGSPLLNLLHPGNGGGRTIYLIGNNGEGKSLLLREIAQASSEHQRKTIGISCSTSDRFPLKSEATPGFENFIYEGARTSDQTANLKRLATDVCRKFLLIHRSTERLRVFEEVLRLIEFDARRYLMPLKAGGAGIHAQRDWVMDHTIELGSDALLNQEQTENVSASTMQIALMRSESQGGITPFRDLSSGEQQIVSLVVKIIAQAEQHCLFLVDEPEISLHVSWQRVLPRVLSVISRYFSCDILVATHSPLLISSVSDDSSVCLSASKQRLTPIEPRDRRSVEGVLFKGFCTHTANNRLIHERCAAIVADAIGIMNTDLPDKTQLQPLLKELGDMRRRVRDASAQLDRVGIERSLEVIKAAREAIQQLTSVRSESSFEEEPN